MSTERPISKETIVICLCSIVLSVFTSLVSTNANTRTQNANQDIDIELVKQKQLTYERDYTELKQLAKDTYQKVIEIDKKIDLKADKQYIIP